MRFVGIPGVEGWDVFSRSAQEVRYWELGRATGAMTGEAWEGSESGMVGDAGLW